VQPSRERLSRIAAEQSALRRVATLVARGGTPAEVLGGVAGEIGNLVNADHTVINRYEPDGGTTVAGHWSAPGAPEAVPPSGGHRPVDPTALRTERPASGTARPHAAGRVGAWRPPQEARQVAGFPIMVGEHRWGAVTILTRHQRLTADPLPEHTDRCIRDFAGLAGTAIANAERQARLTASRTRLVEACDTVRRRIERHLHNSTQQRLVTVALELRHAEAMIPAGLERLKEGVSNAAGELSGVMVDLQEVARDLHPAIISRGGLRPALAALARRSPVLVELDVHAEARLPERIGVTVYQIVSETLTNAARHAHASTVHVDLHTEQILRLSVRDDGVGGADPAGGTGLTGLIDRVEALGGTFEIYSPAGGGTSVRVTLPLQEGPSSRPPS
jgi:signal transduction histidine kinase